MKKKLYFFSAFLLLLFQAKETLTDPEKRGRYDKWLGSGLAVSFKQWESLKGAVHTSMHWAAPRTIGRMIILSFCTLIILPMVLGAAQCMEVWTAPLRLSHCLKLTARPEPSHLS